ncbi:HD domain-containing protein [Candidatus Woesearchaeota archaeon]|nr:HD domain-containing protein [Candidatus Woesearchaeota archaeon]
MRSIHQTKKKDTLSKLRTVYQLKNIERANSVGNRKESTAEHSWSSLILADYFLTRSNMKIDRLKVYELLMYHDVVEIECGDINLLKHDFHPDKFSKENKAALKLKEKLPEEIGTKFADLFNEFQDQKTLEARFAKAIDALDAEIHEMDYKKDWIGWTEEFLRKKKEPLINEFPELKEVFEETIAFVRKEGYFDQ